MCVKKLRSRVFIFSLRLFQLGLIFLFLVGLNSTLHSPSGRIVKAEAEEAHLAAELELAKTEEDQKGLELEVQQQREALEQQVEIARLKMAAESESKRAETEQVLKIQVRQNAVRRYPR